jgi:hypothetical protein
MNCVLHRTMSSIPRHQDLSAVPCTSTSTAGTNNNCIVVLQPIRRSTGTTVVQDTTYLVATLL